MGHADWHPLLHTPPFPEYTSAHAAISMTFALMLEDTFGKNFSFTDHSFDASYGPRSFVSFEAYAKEAALSRLQAGIHYRFSMDEGLRQGRMVADFMNKIKFRKGFYTHSGSTSALNASAQGNQADNYQNGN
jgi:hypothetical protein